MFLKEVTCCYLSQVRDSAINSLVEIYRHVGEKVRVDLSKKGIPSSRLVLANFYLSYEIIFF